LIGLNKYSKNFIISLSISVLFSIITISTTVGRKYDKNTDILLGNQTDGGINILPTKALTVNIIATKTDNHGAFSGLGSFDLYIFNKTLPIQNKVITDKNEIVYTQASNLTFHFVSSKIETHKNKNNIIIQ
jgi:hypothetical protein